MYVITYNEPCRYELLINELGHLCQYNAFDPDKKERIVNGVSYHLIVGVHFV